MPLYQGIPQDHMRGINKVTFEHGAHYPMSVSTPEACIEADMVAQHFKDGFPGIKTVIDVGCCGGHFIMSCLKTGIMAIGVDAHTDAPPCLGAPIMLRDATLDLEGLPRVDAVVCWEMAEHVPADAADVLVKNLCTLSDAIFFSAGIPGYEIAHGHQNCQEPSYWEDKFAEHGYINSPEFDSWRSDLRAKVEAAQGPSFLWWVWSDQSRLYHKPGALDPLVAID